MFYNFKEKGGYALPFVISFSGEDDINISIWFSFYSVIS